MERTDSQATGTKDVQQNTQEHKDDAGRKDLTVTTPASKDAETEDEKQNTPENNDAGIRKAMENGAEISIDDLLKRMIVLNKQNVKLNITKNDGTKGVKDEIQKYLNMSLEEYKKENLYTSHQHLLHAESIHRKLLGQKTNLETPKPNTTFTNNYNKDNNDKGSTKNLTNRKTSENKDAVTKEVSQNTPENKDAVSKDVSQNTPENKDAVSKDVSQNTPENKNAVSKDVSQNTPENKDAVSKDVSQNTPENKNAVTKEVSQNTPDNEDEGKKDARALFLRLHVLRMKIFKSNRAKTDTTEKFTIEIEKYCNMCLKEFGNNDLNTAFQHLLHAEKIHCKLLAQKQADEITKFYKNYNKDIQDDSNNDGTENLKHEKTLVSKHAGTENLKQNSPEKDAGAQLMNNISKNNPEKATEIATTEQIHHRADTNRIFSEDRNVGDNSDSNNSINQNPVKNAQFYKNQNVAENTSINSEDVAEKLRKISRDHYKKDISVASERYFIKAAKIQPCASAEMLRQIQALTVSNESELRQLSKAENCYKRAEEAFTAQDDDTSEQLLLKAQELYPSACNQVFLDKVRLAICDAKNRGTPWSIHEKIDLYNDHGAASTSPNSQKFAAPDLVETSENSGRIQTRRVPETDPFLSVNKTPSKDFVKAEQSREDLSSDRSSFYNRRRAFVYAKTSKDLAGCDGAWEQCLNKAQAALDSGDVERAEKWVKRAQRMQPSDRGDGLVKHIHNKKQQDAIRRADSATNDYDRLGVDRKATLAEVKTAYRKLTLLLHTDRNQEPEAKQAFMIVTDAYKRLKTSKSAAK